MLVERLVADVRGLYYLSRNTTEPHGQQSLLLSTAAFTGNISEFRYMPVARRSQLGVNAWILQPKCGNYYKSAVTPACRFELRFILMAPSLKLFISFYSAKHTLWTFGCAIYPSKIGRLFQMPVLPLLRQSRGNLCLSVINSMYNTISCGRDFQSLQVS